MTQLDLFNTHNDKPAFTKAHLAELCPELNSDEVEEIWLRVCKLQKREAARQAKLLLKQA